MKIHLKNILFISIIISTCLGMGFIIDNPIVINAIILIFIIHWISFIPANIYKTEKFFDLTGSLTYISVVCYVLYSKSKSSDSIFGEIIISASIIIWAIRFGSFLFLRIKKAGEDKRFREFKKSWSRWLLTWTTSGMWVTICSLCALTAISSNSVIEIGLLFYFGLFLFITGLIIEIVADLQKTKFRSIPTNKEKFISTGLWSKSRHPNYVGEITLWFGISIISFSNLNGLELITLISPIFTYWLLVYVSGVNILEKNGQKKWGHLESYKKYIKKTPRLFFKIFG